MLLWVAVLGLSGAAMAVFSRRLPSRTLIAALGAQAALALGFHAFLLLASNPFARLNPPAPEGRGLNPLLQDPGLAFHPPTLYLGYVGLSVAFSLAVGAMLSGDVDRQLARAMRPWVLGAWIFLTLGITAGSYWAYYELGWGGWWFWDPVENASLMPWLAATALLHSVAVLAARNALEGVDHDAGGHRFHHVDGRDLPRQVGHPDVGAFLCRRSDARRLHPRLARHLRDGGVRPVRGARRHIARRGAVRAGQPGGGDRREQPAADGHSRHRVHRDALSADGRGGDRRKAVGRSAIFQRRGRTARHPARHPARRWTAAELAKREQAGVAQARASRTIRCNGLTDSISCLAAGDDPHQAWPCACCRADPGIAPAADRAQRIENSACYLGHGDCPSGSGRGSRRYGRG